MPEGVEHQHLASFRQQAPLVILPLMPEGVEHPSELRDAIISAARGRA
jgi:hypothetical protein